MTVFRALVKKQLAEMFRNLFRGKRSGKNPGRAALIAVGAAVLALYLCGVFAYLAWTMRPLALAGVGWLYFLIMTGIALFLGIFGSVFNTYSSLYQAKDNDLLLSMPIPSRVIVAARLTAVYVMGLIYSGIVMVPAFIIWVCTVKPGFFTALGSFAFIIPVSFFILTLSCALGRILAAISVRVKRKSFISVLAAVVFIAGYYFFYFKAQNGIRALVADGAAYASRIKGGSYLLYSVGRAAEGSPLPLLCVTAAVAVLFLIAYALISHGFLAIATSSGKQSKKVYREKKHKTRSPGAALLMKELARFASSATYMLNCGLGTLLMPAAGIAALIKGRDIASALEPSVGRDNLTVICCAALCFLVSSVTVSAPSVSLEGRNVWIAQSLPVPASKVIRAKLLLHLLMACVPALFCGVCVVAALRPDPVNALLILLLPIVFGVFTGAFGLAVNLKKPNLNWTSETAVVKQSLSIFLVLMGDMAISIAFIGTWFVFASGTVPPAAYFAVWLVLLGAGSALLLSFLKKKGPRLFKDL